MPVAPCLVWSNGVVAHTLFSLLLYIKPRTEQHKAEAQNTAPAWISWIYPQTPSLSCSQSEGQSPALTISLDIHQPHEWAAISCSTCVSSGSLQFRRKWTHSFTHQSTNASTTPNPTSSLLLLHEILFQILKKKQLSPEASCMLFFSTQNVQLHLPQSFFLFFNRFQNLVWFAAPFLSYTPGKKDKSWKARLQTSN